MQEAEASIDSKVEEKMQPIKLELLIKENEVRRERQRNEDLSRELR